MLSGSLLQQLDASEAEEPVQRYRATNEFNKIFSNHTWAANGIFFWDKTPNSIKIFRMQKKKKS